MRSDLCQLDGQLRMKRQQIVFGVQASGNTRLVSDDKDQETRIIQQLDRRLGALDPAEAAARADISIIVIEHRPDLGMRRAGVVPFVFPPEPLVGSSWSGGAGEQPLLDEPADYMAGRDMDLLDEGRRIRRGMQAQIAERSHLPAGSPGKPDDREAFLAGGADGPQDVW